MSSDYERLGAIAKDVVARLARSGTYAEKSDDFRLSAAIGVAEAQGLCTRSGLDFKTWAQHNIPAYSPEYLRNLGEIGRADDPAAALQAARERAMRHVTAHKQRDKLRRLGLWH